MQSTICSLKTFQKLTVERRTLHTNKHHIGDGAKVAYWLHHAS